MRSDPFSDLGRVAQQVFGARGNGGWSSAVTSVAMDAYRDGDMLVMHVDVPGLDPGSIQLDVQRNVLTISGERKPPAPEHVSMVMSERWHGAFSRQVFLGESLDTDRVEASYDAGVLTVRIPVADQAKPRRIQITGAGSSSALSA